jgi:hypothetical protein
MRLAAMRKGRKLKNTSVLRASVTFPSDIYLALESIAKSKKVSVAWVVRDAAEKYIAEQLPLRAPSNKGSQR